MARQRITRRQLLRDAAGAAAAVSAGAIAGCFPDVGGQWPSLTQSLECTGGEDAGEAGTLPLVTTPSKVIEVIREDSVVGTAGNATVQADKVRLMLDAALSTLAGSVDNPWSVLLPDYQPGMRIGLKVNCLSALGAVTSAALIGAIIASLKLHLSIDPSRIFVWERRVEEMTRSPGYPRKPGIADEFGGAQMLGTWNTTTDHSGPDYMDSTCGTFTGDDGTLPRLSRIFTEQTDLTINCPVLKQHISGVTGAMKNIYGIINNPAVYHNPLLQTAIPMLYAQPPIRKRIQIAIMDALQSVTNGNGSSAFDDTPKRILVSRDPVALDGRALDLLNERILLTTGNALLAPSADISEWLDNAYQAGLGSRKYDLVTLQQS